MDAGESRVLSLDQWTLAAWTLRQDVAAARAELELARRTEDVAQFAPNPTLSLTPEFVTNAAAGTSPWTIALVVSQLFEAPAKRQARVAQASAATYTAWWNLAEAYWRVRSEVRRAALDWYRAEHALTLANEERALRSEALSIAAKRVEVGYWDRTELDRARAATTSADATWLDARAAAAAAKAAFAAKIGVDSATLRDLAVSGLEATFEAELTRDRDLDREAGVLNRADVGRALSDYAQAVAEWRAQAERHNIDVTIGPGYTYDRGDRKITLAVDVGIPRRGRMQAEIARAMAARDAAGARLLKVQADAHAAIDQADAAFDLLSSALRERREAVATQDALVASIERRLEAGQADRSELVAARLEATAQQRVLLDLYTRAYLSFGGLEDAIQRPVWPSSELLPPPDTSPPATAPGRSTAAPGRLP